MNKVSLSISGGGVRSAAGLGVLKYLEEKNIEITELSGNSGGAILLLLYSYGLSIDEIYSFLKNINKYKLFRPTLSSFFSLSNIEKQLQEILKGRKKKILLTVVTTNIDTMEANYHNKGDLIKETIASSSINGLFPYVYINNQKHVDGLYVDNLPNKHLVNKEIKNISINVNNPSKNQKIIKRLYKIKEKSCIEESGKNADYFLDIKSISDVKLLDLSKFDYCIEEGYKIAKKEINI